MDSRVFGQFVAKIRKERNLTQAELGASIGVTDKAVSRWERGVGFPDINTLEPLSRALGISLPELMRCEKADVESQNDSLSEREMTEMMVGAVEMARENQRQNKIATWTGVIVTVAVAALVKISSRSSVGGSLFVGMMAAIAAVGTYLFLRNREDREGGRIYGFFMLFGISASIGLLRLTGVDPWTLVWGIFWILALVVVRMNR